MQEKYIGPNKIVGATELDYKTPGGDDVIKVIYENPDCFSPDILPKKVFERLVQDQPMDYSTFEREFRYTPFINNLATLFLEENVRYGDIKYIVETLVKKLDTSLDRATSYLWKGDDKKFNPNDVMKDVSFLEVENTLKKIQKDAYRQQGEENK